MKFRDPKTGDVFSNIERAHVVYCYLNHRPCKNFDGVKCPFFDVAGGSCSEWAKGHQTEAARLMGYEVIEDEPYDSSGTCGICEDFMPLEIGGLGRCDRTDRVWNSEHKCDIKEVNMEKKDKPRLAEVLGVEVGEIFHVQGVNVRFFVDEGGMPKIYDGDSGLDVEGMDIYKAINHPERIIRTPRLTEAELAICKAVGAKWVSRDNEEVWARLWNAKPEFELDSLHYLSDEAFLLALVDGNMFPSVHPGDCICASENCKREWETDITI